MAKVNLTKPPQQLRGRALKEWNRVAPELIRKGYLTQSSLSELAFYCMTFARWQDAEDTVAKQGTLITTQHGNVIQHPALGIANTAMKLCHKFAVEFGLTPGSCGKVKADESGPGIEMPV